MKLKDVKQYLEADILLGEDFLEREVCNAFACDLMSDVLAIADEKTLLLTGLVNPQTIRTAEMMDINAIVFVRGKTPDEETLMLARENEIVLMTTKHILYYSCGILFSKGLIGATVVYK